MTTKEEVELITKNVTMLLLSISVASPPARDIVKSYCKDIVTGLNKAGHEANFYDSLIEMLDEFNE